MDRTIGSGFTSPLPFAPVDAAAVFFDFFSAFFFLDVVTFFCAAFFDFLLDALPFGVRSFPAPASSSSLWLMLFLIARPTRGL